MANIGIKEKKAWGYFSFINDHKYSDVCYIELEASRYASFDDAEVLSEYDAIDEDDYFVENYKPERTIEALKRALELIEQGWVNVKITFYLVDKETKSRTYFKIENNAEMRSFSIATGATLKQKEREGNG
ncbi:hypothetical protein [Thermococcus sp.]